MEHSYPAVREKQSPMKESRDPRTERVAGTRGTGGARLGANAAPRETREEAAGDAKFEAVFETSAEALVVVRRDGQVERLNRRAEELLRSRNIVVPGAQLESFFQASETAILLSQGAGPTGPSDVLRFDANLKSGFPLRVTLRSVLPATGDLLLCLEESSVVERAERKWRETQGDLKALLESTDAGVLILDLAGQVKFLNPRFGQLFSLNLRAAAGTAKREDLEELLAGRFQNAEVFSAPWRAFQGGDATRVHGEIELARPVRRVLRRYARPVLDTEGRSSGWLEIFTDVTEERQIQTKMIQTEKMAALGQLVSGIAHELNNPLTGITGYAQLLLGQNLPPRQHAEASKVAEEAERARRIVKNLLCFAREGKPEQTRVQLNEIVERTLALRSYELKVENIVVECDLEQELPETMADAHQLQQVVLNLLVNAEQALLEWRGQGRIALRTRRASGNRLRLDVCDDGPGIPAEILSRIFDPFFTTKAPGIGTGLGLSIVYGIVQQHGGEVVAENLPAGGARFSVEIPVAAAAAAAAPTFEREAGVASAAPAGRVLVVEDEPTVAQLITDVLQEEGHTVETVLDSRDGLTLLSRRRFNLVICDLRMPRLDGPAFYDALVRAGSPLQRSILFITGDTLSPRTQEFLEGRRLPYLAKPFLVEELKLAVNRLLEHAAAGEAAGASPAAGDLMSEATSS